MTIEIKRNENESIEEYMKRRGYKRLDPNEPRTIIGDLHVAFTQTKILKKSVNQYKEEFDLIISLLLDVMNKLDQEEKEKNNIKK